MATDEPNDEILGNLTTDGQSAGFSFTKTAQGRRPAAPTAGTEPERGRDGFSDPTLSCAARYELKAEHARGGLGRIICARDRQLARDVVIKELLCPGPRAEARFFREALITSRLEHPGIVPVYSAGVRDDGSPFYAMKKIAGRPLKQLIAEATSFEARLRLLPKVIAVAEAIAYAHSERVIHRDLKPSNVIVGEYGETVVIDWGLAKELTDDDDVDAGDSSGDVAAEGLTVAGAILGTPAYMAPEQARGEAVDERADVCALGALLYHVLAGIAPYADASSGTEVLAQVVSQAPRPLAEVQPEVPADLLAIVDKAMAREPTARYPTAKELAADLRRYETGKLVGAHQYSAWQLFARWVGRHRATVIVAVLMLALMTAGGIASFFRITRERDRAEAQRTLASDSRTEVEGLLGFMLTDLRDKLQPVGKLDLLDMVARRASAYYAEHPVDWRQSGDAQKRVIAHENLGEVLLARGDLAGALAEFQAAELLATRLVEIDPHNDDWQRDLADSHAMVGNALRTQSDLAGALAAYRRGQAIAAEMVAAHPEDPRWQSNLSEHHASVGGVLMMQGDHVGALREFRAFQAIAKRLVDTHPDNGDYQFNLSRSHSRVGGVLKAQGDLDGALAEYQAFEALAEQLVARDPKNADWQRNLSFAHAKVGDLLWARNDLAGALAAYQAGREIRARLVQKDPQNTEWQRNLSWGDSMIGDLLLAKGDLAGALAAYQSSAAIRERLAREDPLNGEWQRDLAGIHSNLGSVLERMNDHAGAREHLARAAEIYERVALVDRDFYNAACSNALVGNADKAFEMLARAIDRGWLDHDWTQKDGDLASLREDPRWQPLIEEMKHQQSLHRPKKF